MPAIARKIIRVLIADDSLVAREMLATILSSDPGIEVVGQAADGREAVEMVANLRPDLVTMDIHMPLMDGLRATEAIMAYTPTPILVVSSSVRGEGLGSAFDALALGALEVIKKPEPRDWADLEHIGKEVIRKVKVLANVRVITHIGGRRERREAHAAHAAALTGGRTAVAIGSSTGGPSALLSVLGRLPKSLAAPVLVAQHIADGFVPGLVSWLNSGCQVQVVVGEEGVQPEPGVVYFASTGANMVVERGRIGFSPPGKGQLYIPSADSLFESVARSYGKSSVAVLLTGMGADGAEGMRLLHDLGAETIAQDEETCTVFGMPKAAIDLGAVDAVLPISEIADAIVEAVG
ncbi:MAG: chemotaxis-specific protein-glutamate methyltransferase CheB [Coriobacteriia bacterium]|nr:chemotaxis-specific protein-glutamate methyltransferase CheB [Coriobacteriia bacterium]